MTSLLALLVATPSHAIVIGNNAPPLNDTMGVAQLRYADDDAVRFADFLRGLGVDVTLLALLDADTQAAFPTWRDVAEPPTFDALGNAVRIVARRIDAEVQRGERPVFWLFYSGHGVLIQGKQPSLTLMDGGYTQAMLYAHLDAVHSDLTHVFVDACHAEAIVRPRGERVADAALSADDLASFAKRHSLQRYPHVGAFISSQTTRQSHEWNVYRGGVFTHEVLSGLRGAADVNEDGRIEYSELHAFITAANRDVFHAEAKLEVLAEPPRKRLRAPLLDAKIAARAALLEIDDHEGHSYIEDQAGVRVADFHLENKHRAKLIVPTDVDLTLHSGAGEATFRLAKGDTVRSSELRFGTASVRARGGLANALSRGLFASPYGPGFYRGFSSDTSLLSVEKPLAKPPSKQSSWRKPAAISAWSGAAALTVASVVAGILTANAAATYNTTPSEPLAESARRQYDVALGTAVGTGAAGLACLIGGFAVFPW